MGQRNKRANRLRWIETVKTTIKKMAATRRKPAWNRAVLRWNLVGLSLLLSAWSPEVWGVRTSSGALKKIVIDAGHGGQDTGNPGTGRYKNREKDVALQVALMTGQKIKELLPDVEILYTRDKDYFVTLHERTAYANRNKADLFISIHCDAFTSSAAVGSSTFVMGKDHGDENLRVAQQENSVIFLEKDYKEQYEGFDPSKPETYIALTLYQNHFQERSILLADRIQTRFREQAGRKDRGVKQQPLWVTSRASMPAVLIELGFLTNKAEEDFLNSPKGKTAMSEQIAEAVRDYRNAMATALPEVNKPGSGGAVEAPIPTPEPEVEKTPEVAPPLFRIQLRTSATALDPADAALFKGLEPIVELVEGSRFRYAYGAFEHYEDCKKELGKVKALGFADAFVVAERNGQRIGLDEARALEKR